MILRNHNLFEQIDNKCKCLCHQKEPGQLERCPDCGCPKSDKGWKAYKAEHPQHVTKFKLAKKG